MLTTRSANSQYYSRPADERFKTLDAIHASAVLDARRCGEKAVKLANLRAVPVNGDVAIKSLETGVTAKLTNWSGGQLARLASAPAAYLRTLSPGLAADCLNEGLAALSDDDRTVDRQLYFRKNTDGLTVRSITSTDYSRLTDSTVIERINRLKDVRPNLDLPPVWEGGKGGAYRGDRDMFVIMVDGGSIVEDPTLIASGQDARMFRGIIVRNSEVGAATLEILMFWFRWICGNHNIAGVDLASHFRRRHVGKVQSAFDSIDQTVRSFFDRPASADVNAIRHLAAIELGKDRAEVVTAGRAFGLTETQADASYTAAETFEPNPRSVWGFAQGVTRISQDTAYQDDRFALDMLAAKIMRRHQLVTA